VPDLQNLPSPFLHLGLPHISYNNNLHLLSVRELVLICPQNLGRLLICRERLQESLESCFVVKTGFGDGVEIKTGRRALDDCWLIIIVEMDVISLVAFGEMLASIELEERHVTGFILLLEVRMRDTGFACNKDKDIIRHADY
jgi:hypothetical protein